MQVVLEQIEKRYGDVYAVKSLDLTIASGALHFFLGPSGCGKTTTLRMLAGLETPTKGRIIFADKDVTHAPATERGIGMVFQNYALWPHMTVRKNVEYGLKLRKLTRNEIQSRIREVLAFTQLTHLESRLPGQLSGGQQQRVALARALAVRPHLLLLDEPLSNLDAQLRLEMRDNISRIHKETGITTVYVTHDQKEALSMGTAVSVMRKGILIQTDHPRTIYHHPNTGFIAGFIGETNLIEGTLGDADGPNHLVRTPLGEIRGVLADKQLSKGSKVHVSLRPEAIALNFGSSKSLTGYDNNWSLKLDRLTYLGESEQFLLEHAPSKITMRATVFHTPEHSLGEGDTVEIGAKSSDVIILPYDQTLEQKS